ncbi:MAG: xylulokinase [Synergistaceae bacterium]|nr:xylulokinase [Synergistaceae bacterium]
MRYFIGVDLGTSSVKSLLMSETGDVIGIAQREYDIIKPESSWAEQDIDALWLRTCETLQELTGKYGQSVSGIGYSGQMHGLVMLDRDNHPIRPAIIWADQRSGDEIGFISRVIPDYRNITFNSLSTGFLAASLIWVREHEPANYEKIAHVMLPKDYIRFKMSGELGTDLSDASGTGIFDMTKLNWSFDMISKLGLDAKIFVGVHDSCEIAGKVDKECSDLTGLPEGVNLVYGGGDTLVQTIGNGLTTDGLISNIGTASQLLCPVNQPLHDREFRTNTFCHVVKDQWLLMGANLNGGVALKWLKNILEAPDYDYMTDLALKSEPGAKNLLFLPYLNGERTPYNDPKARGIFLGLSLAHSRKELIRAVMEGVIFSQRETLEIFSQTGLKFSRVIASGGGAKSEAFRSIIASTLKCEVLTNSISEQGCIGAAILAAVGTGTFSSINEACRTIIKFNEGVTYPDAKLMSLYDELFARFHMIYPATKGLVNR